MRVRPHSCNSTHGYASQGFSRRNVHQVVVTSSISCFVLDDEMGNEQFFGIAESTIYFLLRYEYLKHSNGIPLFVLCALHSNGVPLFVLYAALRHSNGIPLFVLSVVLGGALVVASGTSTVLKAFVLLFVAGAEKNAFCKLYTLKVEPLPGLGANADMLAAHCRRDCRRADIPCR